MTAVTCSTSEVALPRYDEMCRAIAQCHRVDEVKQIRDKAEALRAYTRQARNRDAEVQFAEIRVRAERRCGELLVELERNGERAKPLEKNSPKAKLSDLGVNKFTSHRFRKCAEVPHQQFESHLAEHRDAGKPVTSCSVLALNSRSPSRPSEFQRALTALETLSELELTPETFARQAGEERERLVLAITTAAPWVARCYAFVSLNRKER